MKIAALLDLIENSKTTAKAPGELSKPSWDSLDTPDNHVDGKRNREVDGHRGLGDRKNTKPTAEIGQIRHLSPSYTGGPGKSFVKESFGDNVATLIMKLTGPKWGRFLYAKLKEDEPELYKDLTEMFWEVTKGAKGVNVFSDRAAMNQLQRNPKAIELGMKLRNWVERYKNQMPQFDQWAQDKSEELGLNTDDLDRMAESATSKAQQRAAGIALSAKEGKTPKSKLRGASKSMAKMSTNELEKFAGTKHKGLPGHVKEDTSKEDAARENVKDKPKRTPEDAARHAEANEDLKERRGGDSEDWKADEKNQRRAAFDKKRKDKFKKDRDDLDESSKTELTAPGEMDKPKVEKDEPAHQASVPGSFPQGDPTADVGEPDLNKAFAQAREVAVKKIEENRKALEALVGRSLRIVENDDHWSTGYHHALNDGSSSDNPHPKGSKESGLWYDGWTAGASDSDSNSDRMWRKRNRMG